MSEHSLIQEFCETLNQLSERLIKATNNMVNKLSTDITSVNEVIDNYQDTIKKIKLEKDTFFLKISEEEIPGAVDFKKSIDDFFNSLSDSAQKLKTKPQTMVSELNKFKDNLIQGLQSISNNVNLVFKQYETELNTFKKTVTEQKSKITELEEKYLQSKNEISRLETNLSNLNEAYNVLNKQYDELQKTNTDLNTRIVNLTQNNRTLEKKLSDLESMLNKLKNNYSTLNSQFTKIRQINLKLPSRLLSEDLSEFNETTLEKLFNNINELIDLDYKLISKYKNSRSFNKTFRELSYDQVLEQLFRNISDVEEKEFNLIKNKINEVEVSINDQQRQRYTHTDIFLPYLKSAKTLLSSHHKKMAKAANKLLEIITEKLDDPEIKRLLVRRTGIRHINLDNCQLSSYELPLDSSKIRETIDKYLNELNSHLKEKKNELSLKFFEMWRDLAINLKNSGSEVDKIVAYVILLTTQKILLKTDSKNSELRKIFSRSIVLI
ncbi:MAG: hypothetical protein ACTSQY_09555 [Candidatus Odinarchaeia archaeon]